MGFTRNYYNILASIPGSIGATSTSLFAAGNISLKTTAGTVKGDATTVGYAVAEGDNRIISNGLYANHQLTTNGIVIGISATAFSPEQYALQSIIASGTGSGEMVYRASTAYSHAYTEGTKTHKVTVVRTFLNVSGGSIVVRETGLYWLGGGFLADYPTADSEAYMIERTVLDSVITVVDGAILTITYEIEIDMSDIN